MVWMLYNHLTAATTTVIDATATIVRCELKALNTSKVRCASPSPIDVETEVTVQDYVVDPVTGVLTEIHTLIHGYIVSYNQLTTGKVNNTYEYSITELAHELERFRVHSGGSYTVSLPAQALSTSVTTCLTDTGWTAASGCPGSNVLDPVQFKLMTVFAGLNKLIAEMGAASSVVPYWLWFDDDRTVGWGTSRNDRTAVNFIRGIYYGYESYKTVKDKADGVIIYGSGMSSVGQYPATISGHQIAVYQYDDATTDAECETLAMRVYLDYTKDPAWRIQFNLAQAATKVGGVYLQEGDLLQVDGATWVIIDMTYDPQKVQVGLNSVSEQNSIIYRLGDRLKPISGSTVSQVDQSWNPGQQNVSSDGVTQTKFTLTIPHVSYLGPSVQMAAKLGSYRVYSYQNPSTVENSLIDQALVSAHYAATSLNPGIQGGAASSYIPMYGASSYVETGYLTNGFSYGLATVCTTIVNHCVVTANPTANIFIICNYSYDGINWHEGTHQNEVEMPEVPLLTHFYYPITSTYMIPGLNTTTKVWVRWAVRTDLPGGMGYVGYTMIKNSAMLDVLPRHSHDWAQDGAATTNTMQSNQVNDASDATAATPANIQCYVNGNSIVMSDGVHYDVKPYLIDGDNIIAFVAATGVACTVEPSAYYKMFGT
jgi:hypothetical protein